MTARVIKIDSVVPYGDNLTIVTTSHGETVIANRKEDGSWRWEPGEVAVFIAEGSILPDSVLQDRGYWDVEKNRGLLDGGQRNRVKARKWGPDKIVASGLLFKCRTHGVEVFVSNPVDGEAEVPVMLDQDVSTVFNITEHTP